MDLNFLMPSMRMMDYCTQTKKLAHLSGLTKTKYEKQHKNFGHFPRPTHATKSRP